MIFLVGDVNHEVKRSKEQSKNYFYSLFLNVSYFVCSVRPWVLSIQAQGSHVDNVLCY